jgi:hypothetical protein
LTSFIGLLQVKEDFSARTKEAPTHSNSKLEVVQMEKVKRMRRMTKKRKKKKYHTGENEWMILSDLYL